MNLTEFLFGTRATKSTYNLWGTSSVSYSGRYVDEVTAMKVSGINRCIRILSETLGSLPLILYRREGEAKSRATEHPLYNILHNKPNNFQTAMHFWEMSMGHMQLRGASYSQIVRNNGGQVDQLIPLHPDRMKAVWGPQNTIDFEYKLDDLGTIKRLRSDQVMYVPGLASDPLNPYSPLDLLATTADSSLSMQENSAQFFAKSTRPSGILKYPGKLKSEPLERLRKEFDDANSGLDNAFKTILLEDGLDWQQMGLTNEQAQFIETANFTVLDICRFFGIPPHLVMQMDRATFSNIEQQSLEFVQYSLRPWLVRYEQSINNSLLTDLEKQTYYVEFLVDGLLRGDSKSRNESYAIGVVNGWLSRNEVRQFENLNPADGLDEYLIPLNMTENGQEEEMEPDAMPEPDLQENDLFASLAPVVRDVIGRGLRKEAKLLQGQGKPTFHSDVETEKHKKWIGELLTPVAKVLDRDCSMPQVDLWEALIETYMSDIKVRWADKDLDVNYWIDKILSDYRWYFSTEGEKNES